jgi:hypothetical protein
MSTCGVILGKYFSQYSDLSVAGKLWRCVECQRPWNALFLFHEGTGAEPIKKEDTSYHDFNFDVLKRPAFECCQTKWQGKWNKKCHRSTQAGFGRLYWLVDSLDYWNGILNDGTPHPPPIQARLLLSQTNNLKLELIDNNCDDLINQPMSYRWSLTDYPSLMLW